jgi:hypothetical protein
MAARPNKRTSEVSKWENARIETVPALPCENGLIMLKHAEHRGVCELWDIQSMTKLWTCHNGFKHVAYSPASNKFVGVLEFGDGVDIMKCYDLNTGMGVVLMDSIVKGSECQINNAGNRLISWVRKCRRLFVWDLDLASKLFQFRLAGKFFVFSGDDSRIVSGADRRLYAWDAGNGIQLLKIPVSSGYASQRLCCSSNGRFFARTENDRVVVVNLHTCRSNVLDCEHRIICVCFDDDNGLYALTNGRIVHWQLDDGCESSISRTLTVAGIPFLPDLDFAKVAWLDGALNIVQRNGEVLKVDANTGATWRKCWLPGFSDAYRQSMLLRRTPISILM